MDGWTDRWMDTFLNHVFKHYQLLECMVVQTLQKLADVLQRDTLPQPCTPPFTPTCIRRGP